MTHARFISHRGTQILFNFLNRVTGRSLKGFERLDEAKEWLAKQ